MALTEENGASEDMLTGQQLQAQGINSTDLLFFEFLCNKNDIDLPFSWLMNEQTLRIKTDTDDVSSKAKRLIESVQCAFKEIYHLEEEQFRNADEFVNKWKSFYQIGSVFMTRRKNQFIIMALQENVDQFKDCKRKFEVNVFKQICYNTFERIEVRIINGNLEDLDDVDAIVNPTDDQFGQIGLVSRTLSKKGGESYDEECKRLRSSKIPNPKKCYVTSWGNVKEKSILHVVCPKIQGEKSQNVQTTVYETIYNCLKKAERKDIATVAIPFVYTGQHNVPVDECALSYAQAVLKFSMDRKKEFSVNTICFIDTDEKKTQVLVSYFDELLPKTALQIFEMPTHENFQIRPISLQESEVANEFPKPAEVKEFSFQNRSLRHQTERNSCVKDEYETIQAHLKLEAPYDDLSNIKHFELAPSNDIDNIATDDNYKHIKFADDPDESDGEKAEDESMGLDIQVENSDTVVSENTEAKHNESQILIPIDNGGKDQVEILTSGLTIIHTESKAVNVREKLSRETNIQSNEYESPKETENETDKYSVDIIQTPTLTTSSSKVVTVDVTKGNEVKNKADQYETLQNSKQSDNYDAIKNETQNDKDILNRTQKTVGNVLIIDETTPDSNGAENATIMQDPEVNKVLSEHINLQQNVSSIFDGISHSVNAESDHLSDAQTEPSSPVIKKQMNDEEEENNKIDFGSKDVQQNGNENTSFYVNHSEIDNNVGINIEKEKRDSVKSCDKPYCDISVEMGSDDRDYYNLGPNAEAPQTHDLEQVSHAQNLGDPNYDKLKDNYKTNLSRDKSVHIFKGDIRKAVSGVIICPEIPDTKYGGIMAVAIKSAFRNVTSIEIPRKLIKSNGQRIAATDCRIKGRANDSEDDGVSFIYHIQTPIYKRTSDTETVSRCLDLIFKKMKKHKRRKLRRIYIPLLGIEDVGNEDNVKTCCQILVKGIHEKCAKYRSPIEVMLVNRCKRITDMLISEMTILADPSG